MNEPWLTADMSYEEALQALVKACTAYRGEMVESYTTANEHPLHYAIRLVESFQKPDMGRVVGMMRFHLPSEAWLHWGDVMRHSRGSKKMDARGNAIRNKDGRIMHEGQSRVLAKKAASALKRWAQATLKTLPDRQRTAKVPKVTASIASGNLLRGDCYEDLFPAEQQRSRRAARARRRKAAKRRKK